jgi:hypothetical protein
MTTVRVILPYQLYTLARCDSEITLALAGAATLGAALDALEAAHPMLVGALRDRNTGQRRPLIRFYACQDDFSNAAPDTPLPDAVTHGDEPLLIVGAIAGG